MQVDPKKMAVVKKTVNVAAPTGGERLAKLIADSKKLADGREVKVVKKISPGMPGSKKPAQMGEVVITASPIKKAPVAKAIANKLTGKPAASAPAAPAAQPKKEESSYGRYELPSVVSIGNEVYDLDDLKEVQKRIAQTYGRGSDEYRMFSAGVGFNPKGETYGKYVFKPDMRGDKKSYVDTVQFEAGTKPGGFVLQDRYEELGGQGELADRQGNTRQAVVESMVRGLLRKFNVKPGSRALSNDPNAIKNR